MDSGRTINIEMTVDGHLIYIYIYVYMYMCARLCPVRAPRVPRELPDSQNCHVYLYRGGIPRARKKGVAASEFLRNSRPM